MRQLSIEQVRHLFDYNPETGFLYWRVSPSRKTPIGMRAGSTNGTRGVVQIGISRTMWKAHRLAWAHYYGAWPIKRLDHIDGNSANNAIANLRECTMSQNLGNAKRRTDNSSGYKGVGHSNYWKHQNKPWTATIRVDGKRHHIGRYKTPADAHVAYLMAAKKLFGEFARAG